MGTLWSAKHKGGQMKTALTLRGSAVYANIQHVVWSLYLPCGLTDRWMCTCEGALFLLTMGLVVGIIPVCDEQTQWACSTAATHTHRTSYFTATYTQKNLSMWQKNVHNLPLHMQNCHAGIVPVRVRAVTWTRHNSTGIQRIPLGDALPAAGCFNRRHSHPYKKPIAWKAMGKTKEFSVSQQLKRKMKANRKPFHGPLICVFLKP